MSRIKRAKKRIVENPTLALTTHKVQDMVLKAAAMGFATLAVEIASHHALRIHRKWQDKRNTPPHAKRTNGPRPH